MIDAKYSHLVIAGILSALIAYCAHIGQNGVAMALLPALLGIVQHARNAEPPKPGGGPGPIAGAGLLLLVACTPAQRALVPILSQVDAIGMGVSQVMGWCDKAGADRATLARAQQAVKDRDYAQAIVLASEMAAELRRHGEPIPDEAFVTLKLAEGALAAQAIQDGMRALSGTAVHP